MKKIKYKNRKAFLNTISYTGTHTQDPVDMQLFVYNDIGFEEYNHVSLLKVKNEIEDAIKNEDVKWFNIHGLHDVELIKQVGKILQLENFVIKDILNVNRRSKIEELDNVLFFSIKSILPSDDFNSVHVEQISFLLKDNLLVTFQEKKSDFFTHIRENIKLHAGMVRKKKSDFLLYLLLESIIDNFFITIEYYEEIIQGLLVESKSSVKPEVLVRIEKNREQLNALKRAILPMRDTLFILKSEKDDDDYNFIDNSNYSFFGRLHQKTIEVLEQIEYDMNSLDSASNFYFSSQSHRMNEIMKTLTIVSVIFIPLTFIVGVYGMNFENLPGLKYHYGYYIVLMAMFLIVLGMIIYFKNKKWF